MTPEEIAHIEEFAAALMSPSQICIIMGLPWQDYKNRFLDESDAIFTAYHKGKLKTIAETRAKIIKLAAEGSSPAQQTVLEMIEELNTKESHELN